VRSPEKIPSSEGPAALHLGCQRQPTGHALAVHYEPRWRAASPAMRAAVDRVYAALLAFEDRYKLRRRRRRAKHAASFRLEAERLICNVALLHLCGIEHATLSISRSHLTATGSKTRTRVLDTATAMGLLRLAMEGTILSRGERVASRWSAQPSLRGYLPEKIRLADMELERDSGPHIIIRNAQHVGLPLPREALSLDAEMQAINRWLRSLPITYDEHGGEAWLTDAAHVVRKDGEPRPPRTIETAQHVELTRKFRDTLAQGGRLYGGFWINRKVQWRHQHLRLDGERIASCDFTTLNLRLAYQHFGIPWPYLDGQCAYTAGPGDRHGWKAMTLAMLQAKRPLYSWVGRDNAERRHLRSSFPPGTKPTAVVAAIKERHPELAEARAFGHGLGTVLTNLESQLMVAILLECRARGLPALPVHDCLCVPVTRAEEAASLMSEVAHRVTRTRLPVGITWDPYGDMIGREWSLS
jgi:hypothetical protein